MRHGLPSPHCRVVVSVSSLVVVAVLLGFTGACGGDDEVDDTPKDPFFGSQWHLENTGQMGGMPGADVKARGAWQQGATGRGVTIAIFDDGIQTSHEDLREHLQVLPGANLGSSIAPDDPSGDPRFDAHGTSVAGVAVASGNETGVRGIAFDATLMPFRWGDLGDPLTSSQLAAAFRQAADSGAAILSNSWGPPDRAGAFPLPDVFSSAFDHVSRQGRQGRGAMIFFAAGNGNEDVGGDGFASDPRAVAVGASNDLDLRSTYSDFGSALDIAAPSNDSSRASIWTTDRMGLDGFNSGALGPGDYAIGVRSLGPVLDYDLIVGPGTTRIAEHEPNNTPQERQEIGSAATASGTTDSGTGGGGPLAAFRDWFGFRVASGQQVSLRMIAAIGSYVVTDPAGTLLGAERNSRQAIEARGDALGNYTDRFGGTSAACPLAAGAAALVLQANPNLSGLQVLAVLEQSADKIDVSIGDYDTNGHSRFYGFGRINAARAVERAKNTPAKPNASKALLGAGPAPTTRRPRDGSLYWYSAGRAQGLRLDRAAVFVRRPDRDSPVSTLNPMQRAALRRLGAVCTPLSMAARKPADLDGAISAMSRDAAGSTVAPALFTESGVPLWLGPELVVAVPTGDSVEALRPFVESLGLEVVAEFAPGEFRLRSQGGPMSALDAANTLYESGRVRYSHPDFAIPFELR